MNEIKLKFILLQKNKLYNFFKNKKVSYIYLINSLQHY